MKRFCARRFFIVLAAVTVVFASCRQHIGIEKNYGEVVVALGGTARAVTASGLPELSADNTVITITDKDGQELAKGTTGISIQLAIGTEITVKADVETTAGYWTGKKMHTVKAGLNAINVTLSKMPARTTNLSFSPNDDGSTLHVMLGNKTLASKADCKSRLKVSRDGIGRVYLLYTDLSAAPTADRLRRFNVDGEIDKDFTLSLPDSLRGISQMSVDAKTGNIFLIDNTGTTPRALCMTEDGVAYSGNLAPVAPGISAIHAVAAFDGTLFFAARTGADEKLFAVKIQLQDSGTKTLLLTKTAEATLEKLTPASVNGAETVYADMYADAQGVCVLLNAGNTKSENGAVYSAGKIVCYTYTGSGFTDKTDAGLNPAHAADRGIAFDAQYFSKPAAFIGYDKDNLYIADDGADIVYKNENFRADGNKNRIAAFNRQSKTIAFTDTTAKWFTEYDAYKLPHTPVISWEKGDDSTVYGMKYWTSTDGKTAFAEAHKLWVSDDYQIKPSDVFCHDQDGNLYIQYMDGNYSKVRRFALKADGSYDTAAPKDAQLESEGLVTAIAADVSDGKNCLYVVHQQMASSNWKIKKYEWTGAAFDGFTVSTAYTIAGNAALPGNITALAANKDGLFAALRKGTSSTHYTLAIKKYSKGVAEPVDSEVTVENAPFVVASKSFVGIINAMQIQNSVLYCGITTEESVKKYVGVPPTHKVDEFKTSGTLYKVSKTAAFGGTVQKLLDKSFNDSEKNGYGFYRFNALRHGSFVIASDGAWGIKGTVPSGGTEHPEIHNTKKVITCDTTDGNVNEGTSGGKFSKELKRPNTDGGFTWY